MSEPTGSAGGTTPPTPPGGGTPPARPVPHPTVDTAPFWEACAAGHLAVQRCDACAHPRFPPAPICPRCRSRSATWVRCTGMARLRSAVVFNQVYHPAFAAAVPYTVGLVDLDEGPSLYAGVDAGPDSPLRAGARMRLVFDRVADAALPRFQVVEEVADGA